jgi:hypothetical protein
MIIGDMDGLKVVYDRLGKPILEEGESIIGERTATAFAAYHGKKAKGRPVAHDGLGEVGFTLTEDRLIVLIDPSMDTARRVLHLPGTESWTKGKELFKVIPSRGRYYMVLDWSEIPKIKLPSTKKETATIPIVATDGGMYTLLVDRESAAWIERSWKASR